MAVSVASARQKSSVESTQSDPLLFQRRKINFPAIHTAVEKPGEDRMIPAAKQNKPAVRVTAPPERTGGKHIAADFSPPLLVLAEHEFFTFARRHRGDFSAPAAASGSLTKSPKSRLDISLTSVFLPAAPKCLSKSDK